MEFKLLGDVEISAAGKPVRLGSPKQRTLTALLLAKTNAVVGLPQITEELWSEQPPRSATANIRTYAARLRATLPAAERDRLTVGPLGYRLRVNADELDLSVFESAANTGRLALERGATEEALQALDLALAQWHGRFAQDVRTGPSLTAREVAVEDRRLAAEEDRCAALLALRRARTAIAPLQALVAAQPLRERSWSLLMRALYAVHDPAGAIRAFTAARAALIETLGIEPGTELRDLYLAILRRDPALCTDAGAVAVKPRQLPPPPLLAGRCDELERLTDQLGRPGSLVSIHGPAGAGKSALALAAADAVAERYPDGSLYLDLRRQPRVEKALVGLVRAITASTVDPDCADAQLRSLLASRSMLLVLDNATHVAQIRPLIPSSSLCAVLVTSRQSLCTLDGATPLHLGGLSNSGGLALLGLFVPPARLQAEPAAAQRLVELCGQLPLALRIAAARLAGHPRWRLADLAARLDDERCLLDEFESEDLALRDRLRDAYDVLAAGGRTDQLAAKALHWAGGRPAPELRASDLAATLGQSVPIAVRALDRLVEHGLLDQPSHDRYRLPKLTRLFAAELSLAAGP
ncbi:BTAD domain-containing putative transcriptional regulator [Kribbella sp. NPDC056861]|uniref:AfsR/SARP family transcriptional regulator n=1 Tax=Kribbella sp. NPDC056861 TaxID=3154857 RepID=UPI0034211CF3